VTTPDESASRLSDGQLLDWLRLIRSENIGPRTFRELINRYGGASAALEALPALVARSLKGRAIRIADRDETLREIEASRAMGVRFVATSDPAYPPLLRMIDNAPPLLMIRGDAGALARPCVAIVGARNASASGLAFTERLARGLAREDYVIVSGLARGVDTTAHRACVETGTVAVLAGGHARPYPSENVPLLEKIVQSGGAVISEMPLEWEPRGRDFPRRNRLVSGLSLGAVVVEAARRSGSLITARFAAEQGREVFAVPGSPQDPRAEGTNDLLREGATLCACVEDVTRVLQEQRKGPSPGADLFGESAPTGGKSRCSTNWICFPFATRRRRARRPPPMSVSRRRPRSRVSSRARRRRRAPATFCCRCSRRRRSRSTNSFARSACPRATCKPRCSISISKAGWSATERRWFRCLSKSPAPEAI
jgi:DNA processing protein